MAARPGMLRKDIPLSFDSSSSNVFAGGRYLFTQYDQAQDYKLWIQSKFILDGVPFLRRPYFISPDCHAWKTIGARDYGDINTQHVVMRTERFSGSSDNDYVFAAAARTLEQVSGLTAVGAADCPAIDAWRQQSSAAAAVVRPAPWPLADRPAPFGNDNIFSATTG